MKYSFRINSIKILTCSLMMAGIAVSCTDEASDNAKDTELNDSLQTDPGQMVSAFITTEATPNDTDDPAIYIDPNDINNSFIVGTDKDENGGLYAYDLKGNIMADKPYIPMQRPNNVDIEYGLDHNGKKIDIAVATERFTSEIRVVSLPDFKLIDNGGIEVFADDTLRSPMGVSLYKSDDGIYAIVGRKDGPENGYLYQYKLESNGQFVEGTFVRKFGKFSGIKEIESIAVDDELGFVYYSDEGVGVRKYNVHPDSADTELALIGSGDFMDDNEGISIVEKGSGEGYIIVSDQQAGKFNFYDRQPPHEMIGSVKVDAVESDGSEVYSQSIGPDFPNGLFVAMSDDRTFKYYKLDDLMKAIEK
jgi:3-phytase